LVKFLSGCLRFQFEVLRFQDTAVGDLRPRRGILVSPRRYGTFAHSTISRVTRTPLRLAALTKAPATELHASSAPPVG
jgi:hypothetical protein